MSATFALVLLFAGSPDDQTTLPRRPEAMTKAPAPQLGVPTDPLFDKEFISTDGPAFVLNAIESARQGELDAAAAGEALRQPALREAAAKIGKQNESTREKFERLAKAKGWRVPDKNADRASSLVVRSDARTGADFIVQQISVHQATVSQFRAQMNGKTDADLERTLKEVLPGYEQNLGLLLSLKL